MKAAAVNNINSLNLKNNQPKDKIEAHLSDLKAMTIDEGLNTILADEYALFTKTLNYHWNITGPRFYSIHEFLEEQYKQLLEMIDDVAERIRTIGDQPLGTMTEFINKTHLNERPGAQPDSSTMIADLMTDHNLLCEEIRNLISDKTKAHVDPGTEDFLTGLLKKHETMAWKLQSTLS